MKKKPPMTLAEAKKNMIKSGLFAGAAVIVLIVATVAWFSSGARVGVDNLTAEVESGDMLIASFYKYIDVNKDNIIGNDPTGGWVAVGPEENIDTGAMVPGQKSFYKVQVRSTKPNLQINFNNIVFSDVPIGGDLTELVDYLAAMKVELSAVSGEPETEIDSLAPIAMDALLGSPLVDGMSKTVFSVNISSVQNQIITIYYTLEMSSALEQTDLAQGFNISIGEVRVVDS